MAKVSLGTIMTHTKNGLQPFYPKTLIGQIIDPENNESIDDKIHAKDNLIYGLVNNLCEVVKQLDAQNLIDTSKLEQLDVSDFDTSAQTFVVSGEQEADKISL